MHIFKTDPDHPDPYQNWDVTGWDWDSKFFFFLRAVVAAVGAERTGGEHGRKKRIEGEGELTDVCCGCGLMAARKLHTWNM